MIKTKRWCDPAEEDDGFRVLVARYRPRGITKQQETWDGWLPQLGPSKALHAAYYGKAGEPITWPDYRERYLREMESQTFWIRSLTEHAASGKALTLLCSSACVDATLCHRTLLRTLIDAPVPANLEPKPAARVLHRKKT